MPVTVRPFKPDRFVIVAVVVLIEPALTLPLTVIALRLPSAVMPFKVPCDKVPLNVPPVIVPGTVRLPIVPVVLLRWPGGAVPLTLKLLSVPMLVILNGIIYH